MSFQERELDTICVNDQYYRICGLFQGDIPVIRYYRVYRVEEYTQLNIHDLLDFPDADIILALEENPFYEPSIYEPSTSNHAVTAA